MMTATERAVRLPGGGMGIEAPAPDLDAPNRTVLRVRRVDPLRALDLADREWAAAERLRDDAALATGYREDALALERVDRSPGGSAHYSATQMDALRNMARISSGMVMERVQWDVVQYVVLWWQPIRTFTVGGHARREAAADLRKGLAALVEFYG